MVASQLGGFPLHLGTDVFGGSLAQLVEHRAFNPMVIGSNPIRPIHFWMISLFLKSPLVWLYRRRFIYDRVGGQRIAEPHSWPALNCLCRGAFDNGLSFAGGWMLKLTLAAGRCVYSVHLNL